MILIISCEIERCYYIVGEKRFYLELFTQSAKDIAYIIYHTIQMIQCFLNV